MLYTFLSLSYLCIFLSGTFSSLCISLSGTLSSLCISSGTPSCLLHLLIRHPFLSVHLIRHPFLPCASPFPAPFLICASHPAPFLPCASPCPAPFITCASPYSAPFFIYASPHPAPHSALCSSLSGTPFFSPSYPFHNVPFPSELRLTLRWKGFFCAPNYMSVIYSMYILQHRAVTRVSTYPCETAVWHHIHTHSAG